MDSGTMQRIRVRPALGPEPLSSAAWSDVTKRQCVASVGNSTTARYGIAFTAMLPWRRDATT